MKKADIVNLLLRRHFPAAPQREKGLGVAPANIALCKYWGKRDEELNLPMTSSCSIALPDKNAMTTLSVHDGIQDLIYLNGDVMDRGTQFAVRLSQFLDLFRPREKWALQVDITMNIPLAAGLASSAAGFASLVFALNDLFDWQLSKRDLSILARLGSGSAARSLWTGFVEWRAGVQPDGMDSYAEPLALEWPTLCVGILMVDHAEKPISSREAMQRTVNSSPFYNVWPKKAAQDLALIKQALQKQHFPLLGGTAESNALAMHAMMLAAWPPICYFTPETIAAMQKIWALRAQGLQVYFTEDAGPNLKLLFLREDEAVVRAEFPGLEVVPTFGD